MLSSGWLATDSLYLVCRTRYGYPLPLSSHEYPTSGGAFTFPSPIN
jgi:hypothetical protein